MPASLIIPFYKDIPALELILLALNKQSAKGSFEVIIAEDDNAAETVSFLQKAVSTLDFPLQHVSQEDMGFRKCKALNNAVKIAKYELLIFIDGDCIPHKHFVKEYLKEAEEKKILYGRRVNLSEPFTKELLNTKNINKLNLFNLIGTGSTRIKEAIYLPFAPGFIKSKRKFWGCNWGVLKNELLAVNGFDEDFAEYGYEDFDIFWRLDKDGCRLKSVKYQAIVYHLHHKTRAHDEVMNRVQILYEQKVQIGNIRCKNGLEKL